MLKQLDIERSLFPDEYKSMPIDEQQVFYLEQENRTAIAKGLAVLIPDVSIPMTSQQGLSPLADELNQLGWATVILTAPNVDASLPKEPEESTTTGNQTTQTKPTGINSVHNKQGASNLTEARFNKYEQNYIQLLKAAVKKASEYPGYYLVIAQGSSAAWLTKIYAEVKSNIPDALVAISAYWPERTYNQKLAEYMAKTPMPVLDIYNPWDNNWALNSAQHRKAAAVKSLKLMYRQRQLLNINYTNQQAYTKSREIHGWLTNMGW